MYYYIVFVVKFLLLFVEVWACYAFGLFFLPVDRYRATTLNSCSKEEQLRNKSVLFLLQKRKRKATT